MPIGPHNLSRLSEPEGEQIDILNFCAPPPSSGRRRQSLMSANSAPEPGAEARGKAGQLELDASREEWARFNLMRADVVAP